jgi:plastocyanin
MEVLPMNKRLWFQGTLLAAAATVAAQVGQVSPALAGGGGCHAPATNGHGTTVEMINACFTPTVLRVKAGDSVRFLNSDQMQHTVTGTSELFGSYDGLVPGQSVSYKFTTNGVYAYACIFHTGMTGAVVVGDGSGPGLATGVKPVVEAPRPASAKSAAPTPSEAPWAWLMAAALIAGGGLGFLLSGRIAGRTRKPQP